MNLLFKAQLKDAKERIIEGYATTDSWDRQGEKLPLDVAKKAFAKFLESPKICKVHGREEFGRVDPCGCSGVGELIGYSTDEKGILIAAKVTSDAAWDGVVKGRYNGFSVGGYSRANDGVISDFELIEISLVGIPANDDCVFLRVKGEMKMDEEVKDLLRQILDQLIKANTSEQAEMEPTNTAKGGAMTEEFANLKKYSEEQRAEIAEMRAMLKKLEDTPATAKGMALDVNGGENKVTARKVSEVPYHELAAMTQEQRAALVNDLVL